MKNRIAFYREHLRWIAGQRRRRRDREFARMLAQELAAHPITVNLDANDLSRLIASRNRMRGAS